MTLLRWLLVPMGASVTALLAYLLAEPLSGPLNPLLPAMALSALVGALAGMLVHAVLRIVGDAPRGGERLAREVAIPTIGIIPFVPELRAGGGEPGARRERGERAAAPTGLSPEAWEHYHVLAAGIRSKASHEDLRVLLVTSARPGEGKTTTGGNLAVVLARSGLRVLLVDADLRRPRMHEYFGLANIDGLSSVLVDDTPLQFSDFQPTECPSLLVLPSGHLPPNPTDMLASTQMERRLAELRARADFVVVDAPAVLAAADPIVLARLVDGIVLVTDAGSSKIVHLRTAAQVLSRAGGRVLGICLNRAKGDLGPYRAYYSRAEDPVESTAWVPKVEATGTT